MRRRAWVRPGSGGRKPLWRARFRVVRAGEKRAAWEKATSSAGVAEPIAARAESVHGWAAAGGGGAGGRRSRCQRRVEGVRWPVRTMALLKATVTVVAVKATVQPASQSCPMESRETEASSGTM